MSFRSVCVGVAMAALASGAVSASPILDQLPPNGTGGYTADDSQFFESSYAAFNTATLDDFTVSGPTQLTNIYAALQPYNGGSFGKITAYNVEIYSSVSAAANNLVGDVASVSVAPGLVTLTNPYTDASALVNIPVAINLSANTYYLSVISTENFSGGGEIGVDVSGTGNAYQANPGGGFGMTANRSALGVNAAYRVDGVAVPEPLTLSIFGAGLFGAGVLRRRKKNKA